MDVEKPKGSLFSAVDAFFSDTPEDTTPYVKEDVSEETLNHSNRQPLFGKKLGVGAKLEKRKDEEKDGEFKKRLLSRVSNVKNQSSSRRSKKNRREDDDDDDDDDEQKEPKNDEETDDEDEGGRTSVFQQKKKKLPNFAKEDIEIPGSSNKKAKKKKKKGKKERNKEQGEVEEQKIMETENVKDEIEKPPQQDMELSGQEIEKQREEQQQQQPKRRVRRKVRSKQKNIKKDTRLNSEKPVGLQNPKSSEYTGRPMTQETQKFLGIYNEKKRNWGSFFPHDNSAATGDIGLAVDDWLAVNDKDIDENDKNKEKNDDAPDSSKKEKKKKKKDKKLHKKTKKTKYKNLKF